MTRRKREKRYWERGEKKAEKYYGREMGGRGRNTIGRAEKI